MTAPRSERSVSDLESKPADGSLIEFGDFRFDLRSLHLERAGESIPLAPRPAKALHRLLSAHGALVTREELKSLLWPETVVSYEKSLNFCISQVRRALGDSAKTPTFIETRPGLGYRFIAEITPKTHNVEFQTDRPEAEIRAERPQLKRRLATTRQQTASRFALKVDSAKRPPHRPIAMKSGVAAALSLISILTLAVWTSRASDQQPMAVPVNASAATQLDQASIRPLVQRAQHHLALHTPESAEKAAALLKLALTIQPRRADLWTGLAQAHLLRSFADRTAVDEARDSLATAFELGPPSAETLVRQGDLLMTADWKFAEARDSYRSALAIDPHNVDARVHLASLEVLLGDVDAARFHLQEAVSADSVSPLIQGEAGWILLVAKDYAGAARVCSDLLELQAGSFHARRCLYYANRGLGEESRALAMAEKLGDQILASKDSGPALVLELPNSTDPAQAFHRLYLARLEQWPEQSRVERAALHAMLGDPEAGASLLVEAVELRDPRVLFSFRDPRLEPVLARIELPRELNSLSRLDGLDSRDNSSNSRALKFDMASLSSASSLSASPSSERGLLRSSSSVATKPKATQGDA